ncbi:hypothetical protein SAMN06295888_11633 [Desulfonatronum zhilinae]|nr:hypothetical protein SAMN06295888_11633 [Desulfonatronum zhilinae]
MTEKIAWFEEVLRLEPNSKLFFPLAQAYTQDHRPEDAIAILRKGLTFHPEHLEARLLLIECLSQLDVVSKDFPSSTEETPEALSSPELESLVKALAGHPSFWRHWAARSRAEGRTDLAVTLDMLAVQLGGARITWETLLEQGLRAVTGGREELQTPAPQEEKHSTPPEPDPLSKPESDPAPEPDLTPDPEQEPEPKLKTETAQTFPSEPEPVEVPRPEAEAEAHLSEGERRYYETKTYADLLAKQGEHDEALDLYAKLLQTSPDDEQRLDLEARIQELRDRAAKGPKDLDSKPAEKDAKPQPESETKPEFEPEPGPGPEPGPEPGTAPEPKLSIGKGEVPHDADDPVASPSTAPSPKTATTKQTLKKLAERLESRAEK